MKIDDKAFQTLCGFMLQNYGINLEKKRSLIEGRLSQLVTANGFQDFRNYITAALSNEPLQRQMVTRLTTNFTFFQREGMHYEFMVREAIPDILSHAPHKTSLKIWSAGCSSGDEAYTTAMHIKDMSFLRSQMPRPMILGTDISDDALRMAKEGVYTEDSLKNIPPLWKKRYFEKTENKKWKVEPEIAQNITFSKLNLMTNFPLNFHYFDIIFCRNVMIYFTSDIRKRLASKFYAALNPGGYLFIGMSESIPAAEIGFHTIRPSVFKKEG